jgi:hypothetical protein
MSGMKACVFANKSVVLQNEPGNTRFEPQKQQRNLCLNLHHYLWYCFPTPSAES